MSLCVKVDCVSGVCWVACRLICPLMLKVLLRYYKSFFKSITTKINVPCCRSEMSLCWGVLSLMIVWPAKKYF